MAEINKNPFQYRLGGDFAPNNSGVKPSIPSQPKPLKSSEIKMHISEVDSTREALIKKTAWRALPPTYEQTHRITLMCMTLGISEPLEEKVSNRVEARDLIYELRGRLKLANSKRKLKKLK